MSVEPLQIVDPQGSDKEMLSCLLKETFDYFLKEIIPETGLIPDSTQPNSPVSVAVMGLALTAYTVGVKRGLISRNQAVKITLKILRFFSKSKQSIDNDATGYKGFYYHFIDGRTGARAWESEVSTIDTALFIAGALSSACFFDQDHNGEAEIRKLADDLYRRIDWQWALAGGDTICHGWKPEAGFLPYHWDKGYNEAQILYILALGSPTFPISEKGYEKWTSTFEIRNYHSLRYIYAGPLFIHQMSQIWLPLKGIRDSACIKAGFDYFENSRRATLAQQLYAMNNPQGFAHYGEFGWGFTASDGPGPAELEVDGKKRVFYGYIARGAPDDYDDGTVSPWAVVASLPFAPDIVLGTIRHAIEKLHLKAHSRVYGFDASFNPTFPKRTCNRNGWVSEWRFGLNQGPVILMIENFESGLIWKTMLKCQYVAVGLRRAGFVEQAQDYSGDSVTNLP